MKIIRKCNQAEEYRNGYYVRKMLSEKIELGKFSLESIAEYITTIPRGSKCKEQYHQYSYETVFFLDPGIGIINGEKYEFEAGDNLFLEPGDRHEFQATENELKLFAIRIPDLPNDKINIY